MKLTLNHFKPLFLALSIALAGCGGSDSDPDPTDPGTNPTPLTTLSGTAAAGAPIIGRIPMVGPGRGGDGDNVEFLRVAAPPVGCRAGH